MPSKQDSALVGAYTSSLVALAFLIVVTLLFLRKDRSSRVDWTLLARQRSSVASAASKFQRRKRHSAYRAVRRFLTHASPFFLILQVFGLVSTLTPWPLGLRDAARLLIFDFSVFSEDALFVGFLVVAGLLYLLVAAILLRFCALHRNTRQVARVAPLATTTYSTESSSAMGDLSRKPTLMRAVAVSHDPQLGLKDWEFVIATLLGVLLFVPMCSLLLRISTCAHFRTEPHVLGLPSMGCWVDEHIVYGCVATVGLFGLLVFSLYVALAHNERDPTFLHLPRFQVVFRALQFLLVGLTTRLSGVENVVLGIVVALLVALFVVHLHWQPCIAGRFLNHLRSGAMLASVVVCAFALAVFHNDGKDDGIAVAMLATVPVAFALGYVASVYMARRIASRQFNAVSETFRGVTQVAFEKRDHEREADASHSALVLSAQPPHHRRLASAAQLSPMVHAIHLPDHLLDHTDTEMQVLRDDKAKDDNPFNIPRVLGPYHPDGDGPHVASPYQSPKLSPRGRPSVRHAWEAKRRRESKIPQHHVASPEEQHLKVNVQHRPDIEEAVYFHAQTRENVMQMIANLSSTDECQDGLCRTGILAELVDVVRRHCSASVVELDSATSLRAAVAALANVVTGDDVHAEAIATMPHFVPDALQLCGDQDALIRQDAHDLIESIWQLAFTQGNEAAQIQCVQGDSLVQLLQLTQSLILHVPVFAATKMLEMAKAGREFTLKLLGAGVLKPLYLPRMKRSRIAGDRTIAEEAVAYLRREEGRELNRAVPMVLPETERQIDIDPEAPRPIDNFIRSIRDLLAESRELLIVAEDHVSRIEERDFNELKSYKNPPAPVRKVLTSVLFLLSGKKPDPNWQKMRKFANRALLQQVLAFDSREALKMSVLNVDRLRWLKRVVLGGKRLNAKEVSRASRACGPLSEWVEAEIRYIEVLSRVRELKEEFMLEHPELSEADIDRLSTI